MIIKYPALNQALKRPLSPLYIVIGQDNYLINDTMQQLKSAWKRQGDTDVFPLHLQHANDWNTLIEQANHYSLFASSTCIDATYEKKTFDAASKKTIERYLTNTNPQCLILIRASQLQLKSVQWLKDHPSVTLVHVQTLNSTTLQQWITQQLRVHNIKHTPDVPEMIHQYNQNNMLACAQLIDKLSLLNETITSTQLRDQLIDQSDFQLYELSDACLKPDRVRAIQILKHARHQRTEPTLVLWMLTQDIRHLIQLTHATKQGTPIAQASQKLKLWSNRVSLYQNALKRLTEATLIMLLQQAQRIDRDLKSKPSDQSWQHLERLALCMM